MKYRRPGGVDANWRVCWVACRLRGYRAAGARFGSVDVNTLEYVSSQYAEVR